MHFIPPQSNRSRRRVNILAAVIATSTAFIGFSLPAHAISAKSNDVQVKIDSRDLETERGIEAVYSKLERKAEAACGGNGTRGLSAHQFSKTCTAKLLTSFVEDVDHVDLTAYHTRMGAK